MFCKKCGTELPENAMTCTACGTPTIESQAAPQPAPIPEQNRPLSAWAYWGLQILFAVPIIGFIFLIIFSCSSKNINRRNFARSYWCTLALIAIIMIILLVSGVGLAGLSAIFA